MNVAEAVTTRRSIRHFLDTPVDPAILRRVLETARRAPSGGNLQPWHGVVLTGGPLAALIEAAQERVRMGAEGQEPEYDVYPPQLAEPYRGRRFGVGEAMYRALGIAHDNRMGRMLQFAHNFRAFDAPVLMLVHCPRFMGPPQWSDMGMWLMTVMLLLREEGLDSCPQEAWSVYGRTIRRQLGIDDGHILFCGLAVGYRDPEHAVNNFEVARAELDETVEWRGFD
ncbi:nitroreductase family protein [Novosphingopyxis sp.]|uniref:nitroreductase n=1 Tax=Novosphingopyxis sp. TaxID=2709690 RepID=UPI003B5C0E78